MNSSGKDIEWCRFLEVPFQRFRLNAKINGPLQCINRFYFYKYVRARARAPDDNAYLNMDSPTKRPNEIKPLKKKEKIWPKLHRFLNVEADNTAS